MTETENRFGIARGAFPRAEIDLLSPLAEPMTIDGICFLDPEAAADAGALELLAERQFAVRSAVMETMHGAPFQKALLQMAGHLRGQHFAGDAYFQKTPSLRLYLPGALGTSWHCDRWYGHAGNTRTFWIPLTPVPAGAGVRFIDSAEFTDALEAKLLTQQIGLHDINELCNGTGEEWLCEPGQYLTFCGRTLHGSVRNTSGVLRCSIDFRGCAGQHELGSKPLNNYRIIGAGGARDATDSYLHTQAVKYVCGAGGISTKYQHVLIEAYAHDNGMSVVCNEAEIEALPSLPVLSAYLRREAPTANDYAAVIVATMSALPAQPAACLTLLKHCLDNNISLHFVLEDKVFPGTASVSDCLAARKATAPTEPVRKLADTIAPAVQT